MKHCGSGEQRFWNMPLLPGERLLEPLTELLTILQAIPRGRQVWAHMMLFTRERRQLGFSLLEPPMEETTGENEGLRQSLHQRFLVLSGALATFLLLWVTADLASIP
ncbi:hypothetical protein [Salinithrix halophila]|uniref:Uncharacterized protein n=1 Tax=Salinithrix halophila TaxID=1485204 RepID=A0ABV8JCR0_9BACL